MASTCTTAIRSSPGGPAAFFLLGILVRAAAVSAQTPATSYENTFAELWALAPVPNQVADVHHVVFKRDVGQFTLESGKLYLLSPVVGRTVAVLFQGKGRLTFAPPTKSEQARLARYEKSPTLDTEFSELFILFADTTLQELGRQLKFGPGDTPGELGSHVKKYLDYLGDEKSKFFDPDFMSALLNVESNDLFYAHIDRENHAPLMFILDPFEIEGVKLASRVAGRGWSRQEEVVCQFARQGLRFHPATTGERIRNAQVKSYKIDASLPQTGSGDLAFVAGARLEIGTDEPVGPWVPFSLFYKLDIDSARWEGGGPATAFKGHEAWFVWIRLDHQLQPGENRVLQLYYHGDLIDRYGDFFFLKGPTEWYPRSLEGRSLATFDITYHTPKQYLLASVGDRLDSTVTDRTVTTHWVTSGPIRNASFNLGLFEDYKVKEEGVPPVTVMVSEAAHRQLAQSSHELVQQKHMKETVGEDIVKSLKFYQKVFGDVPVKQFYATEIPAFYGEAFPGLVHLSWSTFQQTDLQGEDQVFRAHEVAHQWWGIGVDYATYHDQWLSEGFADFSGLWYLQTVRKDNDKYFGVLERWRANIFNHRDEPSPISMGYRASTGKDENGYNILIYQKGAWVLHMLRLLLIDLKTMNEDRFTETMRDYYTTFLGKRASTADFQWIVEKHAGISMDWFFNEWVYGTDIPTYHVAVETTPAEGGKYRVKLKVTQEHVADDFQMYVPVLVDLGDKRVARVRVLVKGPVSEIELPLMPSKPKDVKFNDLNAVLAEVKQ